MRDEALLAWPMSLPAWDRAMAGLHRTADPGGTFHHTFVRAAGLLPHAGTGGER